MTKWNRREFKQASAATRLIRSEADAGTLMVEGTNVPAVRVPVRLVKAR